MTTMTTTVPDRPLTRADWEALPEHKHKTELLDGEVRQMEMPRPAHQYMVAGLFLALQPVVPPECRVVLAPFDLHINDRVILEPDVIVGRRDRIGH